MFGHLNFPPRPMQAKLEVGAVDDPLEHEADRAAEQVMRMPDIGSTELPAHSLTSITGQLKPVGESIQKADQNLN